MFNHPSLPDSNRHPQRKLPEVAEQSPCTPDADSNPSSDLAAFKVFLKRNMRSTAPPDDLLGKIRGRIDELKAKD